MNLNFENPQNLWSYFCKHFPRAIELIGDCEDPTQIPRKIENREFVSDAFEETYLSLEKDLRDRITSVSTYHACKVIDESSYRERGLRKLRKVEAINWMKAFFDLADEVDAAAEQLEKELSGYGKWNEGGVFTTCSMTDTENRNVGYKEGSEFIRRTAKILGDQQLRQYEDLGSSCYIESRTPLDWFDGHTDNGDFSILTRHLLSHWLLTITNNHFHASDRMNCPVVFKSDIPASMIHHFHYQPDEQPIRVLNITNSPHSRNES